MWCGWGLVGLRGEGGRVGGALCVFRGLPAAAGTTCRGHAAEDGGEDSPPPLEYSPGPPAARSSLPASHVLSLLPPSLPLPLLPAPPVKGKRKQSEDGDPLDPPVSPQPDAEQNRSQSPVQLEVSWTTPLGPSSLPLPHPRPTCV